MHLLSDSSTKQSTVAVWALLMGSTWFFVGLLWFLESLAASMRAYALRDRIRTLLLLSVLFFFAWLIAGNVWSVASPWAPCIMFRRR